MKIGIGFHQTDRGLAEEIKGATSHGDSVFVEMIQEEVNSSVSRKLLEGYDFNILILSENFLKSVNCMDGCLDLINQQGQKLIPIVAPGTVLNKVTHIIRYINFWQDQYLELRKGKEDTEEYQTYLSTVRTISTEVGEFVRMLRNLELLEYDEEKNSNFNQVLALLGLDYTSPPPIPQTESQISEGKDSIELGKNYAEGSIQNDSDVEEGSMQNDNDVEEGSMQNDSDVTEEPLQEYADSLVFEDLIEDDENTDLLNKLAEEYIQKGEYENAKITLNKIKDLDPFYPNVHLQIAILEFHFLKQNAEIALEHIERAILQNEKDSEPYYQKGLILNHLGAEEEKIRWQFEKAIELNSEHPFATYELALSYLKIGDIKQANKLYLKSIDINPETKSEKNDKAFALPKESKDSPVFTENIKKANESEQGSNKKISDFISDLRNQIEQLQELLEKSNIQSDNANPYQGKVVLITGASSGIGKATVIKLAQEGFGKIIVTGRRADKLSELKEQIESHYPNCIIQILCFDISRQEEVETSIQTLLNEEPKIDILVNNAGKAKGLAPINDGSLAHWEEMIDTNIKGLLYITRLIAQHMVERKEGHILNIGSTAGKEVYPSGNVYCATKFAVEALTKAFRLDLYKHNIRVSQVSPGHVEETEFAKVRFDGDEEKSKIYEDFVPLSAKDVADAIAYILTRPPHVNIQDILLMGKQQAGAFSINRSGR
jgi:NADP-dependent 3-hydroxy acid dehydrogenase YdfG/Tfp pilus assembly protein PilF